MLDHFTTNIMKIYVTFEKTVKEVQLPEDKETVTELKKLACAAFGVEEDQVVLRSGTRPIKDTFQLKPESNINMGRIKPSKEEEALDPDDEYEYVYEEVTDTDEDYADGGDDDDDDDDEDDGDDED